MRACAPSTNDDDADDDDNDVEGHSRDVRSAERLGRYRIWIKSRREVRTCVFATESQRYLAYANIARFPADLLFDVVFVLFGIYWSKWNVRVGAVFFVCVQQIIIRILHMPGW